MQVTGCAEESPSYDHQQPCTVGEVCAASSQSATPVTKLQGTSTPSFEDLQKRSGGECICYCKQRIVLLDSIDGKASQEQSLWSVCAACFDCVNRHVFSELLKSVIHVYWLQELILCRPHACIPLWSGDKRLDNSLLVLLSGFIDMLRAQFTS